MGKIKTVHQCLVENHDAHKEGFKERFVKGGLKRGHLHIFRENREMGDNDNFVRDAEMLKRILFGGKANIGKHHIDGKLTWNVWVNPQLCELCEIKNSEFVILNGQHFRTKGEDVIMELIGTGVFDIIKEELV